MKRSILSLFALSAFVATAGLVVGQTQSGNAAAAAVPKQKLIHVATIKGVEANREFQNNVQLLQSQRQAAIDLNAAMEKEKDPQKKKELKAQFDAVMAKLNENNAKMAKTYGFSLTHNYAMEIETSNIYVFVTDEEAAKLEQLQKEQAQKDAKKAKK